MARSGVLLGRLVGSIPRPPRISNEILERSIMLCSPGHTVKVFISDLTSAMRGESRGSTDAKGPFPNIQVMKQF